MRILLPHLIQENWQRGQRRGQFAAASLFADILGFTAVTEALMQHGQEGAESLANITRAIFEPLVQSVYEQGGLIPHTMGDAFMALFPEGSDSTATLHALAAALNIQQHMAANAAQATPYGTFNFVVKVGVAAGQVEWGIVSSSDQTRHAYYFKGPAVEDCTRAENQAKGGEIVLTRLAAGTCAACYLDSFGEYARLVETPPNLPMPQPIPIPALDPTLSTLFFPSTLLDPALRGEFRQMLTLFINLTGEVDHAQLSDVVHQVFDLQAQYGGYLNKIDFGDKGCTIVLFWGAPLSYESDLVRALSFALDLQAATHHLLRAGMTHRMGYAGFMGAATREDYTGYGRGVNLAARLMQSAPWGALWMDAETAQRAAKAFVVESLGARTFKGFAEPQAVYALKARQAMGAHFYSGTLLGRECELDQLREFVQPIFAGKFAGTLAVVGEIGVGKSRLVHEFAHQFKPPAGCSAPRWLLCQTDEILRLSLNPFRYLLRAYFEQTSTGREEENKARFAARFEALLATTPDPLRYELDRVRSFLGALVELYWPDSLYTQLEPRLRFENTLDALAALLQAESLRQPIVVQLEDLQWLDADSKQFLQYLGRVIANYPVAIIATSRERPAPDWFPPGTPQMTLELNTLPATTVSGYASAMLNAPVAPKLVDLLVQRAECNPFFMEQLLRYLQEQNLLTQTAEGLQPVASGVLLPTDVRTVLVARLDRLTQDVKQVVQTAAVLGREFEVRVLSQMLQGDPTLPGKLAHAEQQAIWLALTEIRYIFKHTLLRDTAYDMQLVEQRRKLHALALDALETVYADDLAPHYGELAYHAEHCQDMDKQRLYFRWAGEAAQAAFANAAAMDYYRRLLPLLDTNAAQAVILLRIATIQSRIGEYDQAISTQTQVLGLLACAVEPEAASVQIAAHLQMGKVSSRRGMMAEAKQQLETARAQAKAMGDRSGTAEALGQLGLISLWQGSFHRALEYLGESLPIARALNNKAATIFTLRQLGNVFNCLGRYDEALAYLDESLELARLSSDQESVASALCSLGSNATARGEYDTALRCLEEAVAITQAMGDRYSTANYTTDLCNAYYQRGDYATVQQLAKESLALAHSIGSDQLVAWALAYLGLASVELRQTATAKACLDESLRLCQVTSDVPRLMLNLVAYARLHTQAGQDARAAELLGLVLAHPSAQADTQREANKALKALRGVSTLSALELDVALAHGRTWQLEAAVQQLMEKGEDVV